jgi:purine-cytosine permease-like protein
MPCFVGCLAILFPRVALFLVWLLGGSYLEQAFQHWLWPFLGFLFLPLTTLAFAYGVNSLGQGGSMPPLGWLLVALALAVDVGLMGGGGRDAYRYRQRRR